jgi:tryptophan-rich sensory protein
MNVLDSPADPKRIRALKIFLITTLAVGAVGSVAARPLPVMIAHWVIASWALAPLWTLSYGLMAVAAWLVWKRAGLHSPALAVFAAQLLLNLIWRIWPVPALAVMMDLCVLATLALFARRSLNGALTFLPCAIWDLSVSLPIFGL